MGLFNKFFKIKTDQTQEQQLPLVVKHNEEWDFYFSDVDDIIGSFYIDLGLAKVAPLKSYSNLIWVSAKMNNPQSDGLSSNEESNILYQIEDRLINFISKNHQAIYTGRLTSNGRRDFYFYFVDPFLHDKTIAESMIAFPYYEYDFGIKDDIKWDHYFEFQYPLPRQFQSIQNRRVLDQLEKKGETLVKERQVDHWLYFKTSNDKDAFLQKIKNDRFNIIDDDYNIIYGASPYRLHISRIDKVDFNNVDNYTLYLWELAQECNGEYDGWETSVEKE